MSEVDLSVVIVNYNTRELVVSCVDSIFANTFGLNSEIIVVDNASSDNSVEVLRGRFPRVSVIANGTNRGFASANNQGIKAAKGGYVLLLNSDTVVLEDCLKGCVKYMDNNPGIGILGAQVLTADRHIQTTCFRQPNVLSEVVFFGVTINLAIGDPITKHKWMSSFDRRSVRDVDCLAGCFLFIRKAVFDIAGYLDEKFFMYYEDAEFCGRVRRLTDYKIVYYPYANIMHYGAMSVAPENNFKTKLGFISARQYFSARNGTAVRMFFNAVCKCIWMVELVLFLPLIFLPRIKNKAVVICRLFLT